MNNTEKLAQQINEMLFMQNDVNEHLVDKQWREKNLPFYRAIWIESSELMEHIGYKWWKKQTPNIAQAELELIDIWHFGLSDILQNSPYGNDIKLLSQSIAANIKICTSNLPSQNDNHSQEKVLQVIEQFSLTVLQTKAFDVNGFIHLLNLFDMNLDDVYKIYIGKAVLNKFRQDFGYKAGTYQKNWSGKEDNEYLYALIEQTDANTPDISGYFYQELTRLYHHHNGMPV